MPTVVIAHEDANKSAVEEQVLSAIGATIVYERNTERLAQLDIAPQVDALMVGTERVPAALLDKLTNCRIVSRVGVGLDAIAIPEATSRGIWVTNVPDFPIDEVSTQAMAMLLSHARRLPLLMQQSRQHVWNAQSVRPIPRLKGQTLGLLGFGRLGRQVAVKARGFGLNLIAHDPYLDASIISSAGVQPVTWHELLRASDFISLHAPLTPDTYHIVNADALALVKPTAYLINTARGGLIDADALVQAVREGRLAGAALDVFETEPLPSDHPLWNLDQVIITPHVAWYSEDSMHDVKVRASEEVVRVLRGETPRNPANQIAPRPAEPLKET
jgi:D-3-phosphoglycerate dehydrogenase